MFSLRDLHFLLCSRDLDVLRAQLKDYRLSYLNYPQFNEVGKSDHGEKYANNNAL